VRARCSTTLPAISVAASVHRGIARVLSTHTRSNAADMRLRAHIRQSRRTARVYVPTTAR
jgi:hypothetical protein